MRLDLRELLRTPGGRLSVEFDDPLTDMEGLELVSSVSGRVTAYNSRRHIVVRGKAHATVAVECSRCLSLTEVPLDADLEALCEFRQMEAGRGAQMVPEDLEAAVLFDETTANIDELVRQGLILQLPLQILCKPECEGICVGCGANLNCERCQCAEKTADPRLSILKTLLDRGEQGA